MRMWMRQVVVAPTLALCWLLQTGATVGDPAAEKAEQARKQYAAGEFAGALELYRQAQVENPDSPLLHFNVGDALFKTGDYETALKEFEQALAGGDGELGSQALYNMGNVFFQQQQFPQAVEAYKQALEQAPGDQDAKVNLELALEMLQQQQQQQQNQQDQREQDEQDEQDQQQQQGEQEQQQDQQDEQDQQQQQQDEQDQQQQNQQDQQQSGTEEEEKEGQQLQPQESNMDPEEAENLLDALKDREKQAQLRRFRSTEKARDKDW